MLFNMLEKIEYYLKENNIKFDEFEIDGNKIDDYFRTAVTNIIRRMAHNNKDNTFYFDDAKYYLKRDNLGALYMEAISRDKKYKVIICSNLEKGVAMSTNENTAIFNQKIIMQDASVFKALRNIRKKIRYKIQNNEETKKLTPLEKRIIECKRMKSCFRNMYQKNSGKTLLLYHESKYFYDNQRTIDNILESINNYYATAEIIEDNKQLLLKK